MLVVADNLFVVAGVEFWQSCYPFADCTQLTEQALLGVIPVSKATQAFAERLVDRRSFADTLAPGEFVGERNGCQVFDVE